MDGDRLEGRRLADASVRRRERGRPHGQVRRIAEGRNSGRLARLRVKLGDVVFVLIHALADLVNGG
jgi:hypothetical protein